MNDRAGARKARDSELRPARVPSATLAERLQLERQRAFVGRVREIATFQRVLAENTHSLLVVTGQAGVGKSAWLHELERLALAEGRAVASFDARDLSERLGASRAALFGQLSAAFDDDPSALEPRRGVLLIDAAERTSDRLDHLLNQLLPALDADVLVVLATRSGPQPVLALDSAWSRLTAHVHLAPLDDAEATELLERRGVPSAAHDHVLELAAGFPLALAVAAELTLQTPSDRFTLEHLQRVQHALARLLCPEAVTPAQQLALDVCSIARITTAELLDHVRRTSDPAPIGNAPDCFDWLAHQAYIDWTPQGLEPHPLLRVALQARLRRERPRRHRSLLQTLRDYCVAELESGTSPDAEFLNLVYLDRDLPLVRRWAPPSLSASARPLQLATAEHRSDIIELVRSMEGEEAATLASQLLRQDGERFEIVEDGQLEGFLHSTRFDALRPASLPSDDPAAAIVHRYMAENPLQGEEEALFVRWFMDREHYQTPSARVLAISGRQTQLILASKHVRYSFCVFRTVADWMTLWNDIGLPWQVLDRFTLGGNEYSVVMFSWQRRSLREVMINSWRSTGATSADAGPAPVPLDELRVKVGERVSRLAKQVNLTPREVEILEQLCLGHSFEDIARALSIRPRTVKFHQENLLRKTGAASRVELFRKLL